MCIIVQEISLKMIVSGFNGFSLRNKGVISKSPLSSRSLSSLISRTSSTLTHLLPGPSQFSYFPISLLYDDITITLILITTPVFSNHKQLMFGLIKFNR